MSLFHAFVEFLISTYYLLPSAKHLVNLLSFISYILQVLLGVGFPFSRVWYSENQPCHSELFHLILEKLPLLFVQLYSAYYLFSFFWIISSVGVSLPQVCFLVFCLLFPSERSPQSGHCSGVYILLSTPSIVFFSSIIMFFILISVFFATFCILMLL